MGYSYIKSEPQENKLNMGFESWQNKVSIYLLEFGSKKDAYGFLESYLYDCWVNGDDAENTAFNNK